MDVFFKLASVAALSLALTGGAFASTTGGESVAGFGEDEDSAGALELITLFADQNRSFFANFDSEGGEIIFTFTAGELLRVQSDISAAGTGFTGGADLGNVSLGIDGNLNGYDDINDNDATANATADFPGFILEEGESFTFTFNYSGGEAGVQNNLVISTAAVPVPASALMLLTALGGVGAVARRKAKKTA